MIAVCNRTRSLEKFLLLRAGSPAEGLPAGCLCKCLSCWQTLQPRTYSLANQGDSNALVAKNVFGLWSVTTVNSTPSRHKHGQAHDEFPELRLDKLAFGQVY
ncbi:hypothetical protein WJX77_011462 [Trebouxia sp. C0004]